MSWEWTFKRGDIVVDLRDIDLRSQHPRAWLVNEGAFNQYTMSVVRGDFKWQTLPKDVVERHFMYIGRNGEADDEEV